MTIDDLKYCVTGGDYIDNSGITIANKYSLNYNDIFTYNIAATKELDSIVQEEQRKNVILENTVTILENTVSNLQIKNINLENTVNNLENNNINLENTVTILENEYTILKNALNNLLTELGKNTI